MIIGDLSKGDEGPIPVATGSEPSSSMLGAAGRSIIGNVGGIVGGSAGITAGSSAGGAIGGALGALAGPEGIPIGAGIGQFLGGIAGAAVGGYAGGQGEAMALNALPTVQRALGQNPSQRFADQEQHPYATFAGDLAAQAIGFKPNVADLTKIFDQGATAAERLGALGRVGAGAAAGGGMAAAQDMLLQGHLNPTDIALGVATGGLFNDPRLGGHGSATNTQTDNIIAQELPQIGRVFSMPDESTPVPPAPAPGLPQLSAPQTIPLERQLGYSISLPDQSAMDPQRNTLFPMPPASDSGAPPATPVPTPQAQGANSNGQLDMFEQTPTALAAQGYHYKGVRDMLQIATNGDTGGKHSAPFFQQVALKVSDDLTNGKPDGVLKFLQQQNDKLQTTQLAEPTIRFRQNVLDAANTLVDDYLQQRTRAMAIEGRAKAAPGVDIRTATKAPDLASAGTPGTPEPVVQPDAAKAQANQTVDDARAKATQDKRAALLQSVVDDPTTVDPIKRFVAQLKRNSFDPAPTAQELSTLIKFENARDAFTGNSVKEPPEIEPSGPNEMDVAKLIPKTRDTPVPGPAVAQLLDKSADGSAGSEGPDVEGLNPLAQASETRTETPTETPTEPAADQKATKTAVEQKAAPRPIPEKIRSFDQFQAALEQAHQDGLIDDDHADTLRKLASQRAAPLAQLVDELHATADESQSREVKLANPTAETAAEVSTADTPKTYDDVLKAAQDAFKSKAIKAKDLQQIKTLVAQKLVPPEHIASTLDDMQSNAAGTRMKGSKRPQVPDGPQVLNALPTGFKETLARGGDAKDVLQTIATGSKSNAYRVLASKLIDVLQHKTLATDATDPGIRDLLDAHDWSGAFDSTTRTIHVDSDGTDPEGTFLHEAVHAATSYAIDNETPAGREIEQLYNDYKSLLKGDDDEAGDKYGFLDAHEFVAEALANPDFQDTLKQLRDRTHRTLWQRLVAGVRRVLRMPPADMVSSLLDRTNKLAGTATQAAGEDAGATTQPPIDNVASTTHGNAAAVAIHEKLRDPTQTMKTKTADVATDTGMSFFKGVLNALSLRQKEYQFAKYLPSFTDLRMQLGRADGIRRGYEETAAHIWHGWKQLPDAIGKEVGELLLDSREKNIDPRADKGGLGSRYNALGTDGQKVFNDVRLLYRDQLSDAKNAAIENLKKFTSVSDDEKDAAIKRLEDNFDQITKKVGLNYAPHMRYGDYVTIAKTPELLAADKDYGGAQDDMQAALAKGDGDEIEAARQNLKDAAAHHAEIRQRDLIYEHHEKLSEQNKRVAELKAKGYDVQVRLRHSVDAAEDVVPNRAVRTFNAMMDKEILTQDRSSPAGKASADALQGVKEMLNQTFMSMMPEGAPLARNYRSDNIQGYSRDALRTFSDFTRRNSSYLAALKSAPEERTILDRMKGEAAKANDQKANRVYESALRQYSLFKDHARTPVADLISNMTYTWMLGGSPSFTIMHLAQTPMVTLPMMAAREGYAKSTSGLVRAAREVVDKGWNSALAEHPQDHYGQTTGERTALKWLDMHELFGGTYSSQFRDAANDADFARQTQTNVMKIASFLPHHTEKFNRVVTGLAAFRNALTTPKIIDEFMPTDRVWQRVQEQYEGMFPDTAEGKRQFAATQYAERIIADSHIDYSGWNAPSMMQPSGGAAGLKKMMFQFQKYQQGMLYQLTSDFSTAFLKSDVTREQKMIALRTMGGILGSHALVTGMMGLPGFGVAALAANLYHKFLGDQDEPFDAEATFERALTSAFGMTGGSVAARGILYMPGLRNLFPADVTDRLGMGDLLASPSNVTKVSRDDALSYLMQLVSGPSSALVAQAVDSYNYFHEGDAWKGVEALAPKVFRDLSKVGRYSMDGVTSVQDSPIVKAKNISTADLVAQGFGFQPQDVRTAEANRGAITTALEQYNDRRQVLLKEYSVAAIGGDEATMQDTAEKIQKFNAAQMRHGLYVEVIKGQDMGRAVLYRRLGITRLAEGVSLSPRQRMLQQYGINNPSL